jgi:hypothetical protein
VKHRGSKDKNHDALTARFEQLGCSVADMATCGVPDFPDVVVGCMGVDRLVEYKNPDTDYGRRGLTQGQQRFARDWRGCRPYEVRTVEEVTALVQNWRRPQ